MYRRNWERLLKHGIQRIRICINGGEDQNYVLDLARA